MLHGKPLRFIGQFPLDPAREAGVLPISVPARSMMTVFGGEDWEPGPCEIRCPVFIHSIDGLKLHTLPAKLERSDEVWEIVPQIVEELPAWEAIREILDWELGQIDPKILREFQDQKLPELPSANDGTKIGGWPHWIQSADSDRPLLLQIASDGLLYVFVEENGKFTCLWQFD